MPKIIPILLTLVTATVLSLSLRGNTGNPKDYELNTRTWREDGPFELSPERGRFALTYSLVENSSYYFSPFLAVFVAPDVAVRGNGFVSLFPPGLSYAAIPGYLLGRYFGASQAGSFATSAFFAALNVLLLYKLSRMLGASVPASAIASLVFIFGSPAYTYAVSLYQHHLTTFMLLLSIYFVLRKPFTPLASGAVWLLSAAAFVVDVPNIFFFIPVSVVALYKSLSVSEDDSQVKIGLKPIYLAAFAAAMIPFLFLAYFNYKSYGNPLQLGGMMRRATEVEIVTTESGQPEARVAQFEASRKQQKTAASFFHTRNIPNGLYTHFMAPERGIIFYTPVILFSLLGLFAMRKEKYEYTNIALVTMTVIILLYSLWGDPYGGWAFGSRYLIPVYALLTPFIAKAVSYYRSEKTLILLFVIFSLYSIAINTVGALTTSVAPPNPELESFQKISGIPQPGGYLPNFVYLLSGNSKSFVYRLVLHNYISSAMYGVLIMAIISISFFILLAALLRNHKRSRV